MISVTITLYSSTLLLLFFVHKHNDDARVFVHTKKGIEEKVERGRERGTARVRQTDR